jgi:ABC-type antimicrobial peptide transport system permease subunit
MPCERPFGKGASVFLVVFLILALLSALVLGGDVRRLGDVRLQRVWTVLTALVLQILVITIVPDADPGWLAVIHVASYAFAGYFIWLNRRVPGLVIVGLGWALNALVIAVNGGVMPASPRVAESGSRGVDVGREFLNSRPLDSPRLSFLGDNFSLPQSWPFHNVFSIGDVFIALGVFVALHWICNSFLARAVKREKTA